MDAGVSAILHTKLGVGEVGNKVQAIATFLKTLELGILPLQSLSPVSLKEVI